MDCLAPQGRQPAWHQGLDDGLSFSSRIEMKSPCLMNWLAGRWREAQRLCQRRSLLLLSLLMGLLAGYGRWQVHHDLLGKNLSDLSYLYPSENQLVQVWVVLTAWIATRQLSFVGGRQRAACCEVLAASFSGSRQRCGTAGGTKKPAPSCGANGKPIPAEAGTRRRGQDYFA